MALPFPLANVSVLRTPDIDANNAALGALTVIPCTATGTNTIALTPAANTPTISAYSNLTPVFAFIAAASNSGATTININGLGAKNLYKNNGATAAGSGDIVVNGLYLISYNSALNGAVGGFVLDNPSASTFSNTTTTRLITGGPLTYTPPAGAVRFRVRMVGGGGGGGATVTNAGVIGTATSFQVNATGTAWTAAPGGAGPTAGTGAAGAGGTGGTDGSTGNLVARIPGANGSRGLGQINGLGGYGGSSVFGGGGDQVTNATNGVAAKTNTGSGGSSAGINAGANPPGGGGAGEYVEFWVTGMTTATYTVGPGGAGGAAGTNSGGAGATGIIIIEEFYL